MFCPYFHFFHREPHIVLVNLAVRLSKLALLDTDIMQEREGDKTCRESEVVG